jgi:hypothetical protein
VTDSAGASDSQTFSVTVRELNNPPVFDPVTVQNLAPGEQLRVSVVAQDPDRPNPNPVRYSLDPGAPEGAAVDPQTGELTWTIPGDFPAGNVDLVVRATEVVAQGQTAASSTLSVRVVVAADSPNTPTSDFDPLILATFGTALDEATAADPSGDLFAFDEPDDVGTSLLLAGTFEDRGLLGTRIAPQGGMHQAQTNRSIGDRIDGSSPQTDGNESEDRIDSPSSGQNAERSPRRVSPEAADAALEALAAEDVPAETPAPSTEELAAAVAAEAAAG